MPRPTPAERVMPIDWSTRPSSSIATHSDVKSPLAGAAVLLGHDQPEQPEVAHLAARGRPGSGARGPTARRAARPRVSAKSRTTLRKSSWSSDSSNIAVLPAAAAVPRSDAFLTFTSTLRKTSDCARASTRRPHRNWTVGELAEEFGVTTRTLRFYEAEGLITPERRGTSGSTARATGPGCG